MPPKKSPQARRALRSDAGRKKAVSAGVSAELRKQKSRVKKKQVEEEEVVVSGSEGEAEDEFEEQEEVELEVGSAEESTSAESGESDDDEIIEGSDEDEDDDDEAGSGQSEEQDGEQKSSAIAGPNDDDYDSSEDEMPKTTIGNVPIEWYDDLPHIGYDLEGKPILKKDFGDALDDFLAGAEDPNRLRSLRDEVTGEYLTLSPEEMAMIKRLRAGQVANDDYDPYPEYQDFFTGTKEIHPISSAPEPKRRFLPSKWEHKKVVKIVRAIREGRMKPKVNKKPEPNFLVWDDDAYKPVKGAPLPIPAPQTKLPGHAESYNPPPEYIPTAEEKAQWEELDPEDRPYNFEPKRYKALRQVPGYGNFIKERFERCLDLYLCPRVQKYRLNIDPKSLIPKLPSPKDLRPFPTAESLRFDGHTGMIRCLDTDPTGQWMVSGSDDSTCRLWEIRTGRCMRVWKMGGIVNSLKWCPARERPLLAVAVGDTLHFINTHTGTDEHDAGIDLLFAGRSAPAVPEMGEDGSKVKEVSKWSTLNTGSLDWEEGRVCTVKVAKPIKHVSWHSKGDYICSVSPDANHSAVLVHQLSKMKSQNPFTKNKGQVQRAEFHPTKPFFFVATQRYVRVYNLVKQELVKKLLTGCKWVSSLAIHPGGDNVICGSYDKRLCWFDLDLSVKPYRCLRFHHLAIRQVVYHPRYPLFASCSDDATIHVFHGMVYNDLLQNPLIVPVKILRGHSINRDLGVLDMVFHPTQPWIFSAGSDHSIRLFT